MSNTNYLKESADHYFQRTLQTSLDDLLAPLAGPNPAGIWMRELPAYKEIDRARSADDPSVPRENWDHELKRADWAAVSRASAGALSKVSKDIELAAWLLQAQIAQHGFAGIAPCMVLLRELLEQYWDDIYPAATGGDLRHRANHFGWINDKLLPALRLVPVTITTQDDEYSWSDWERAHRNEQLKARMGSNGEPPEGATLASFQKRASATSTDNYRKLNLQLSEALLAMDELGHTLDARFHAEAPGLGSMAELLQQILSFVGAELHKRGIDGPAGPATAIARGPAAAPGAVPQRAPAADAAPLPGEPGGPPRDRADAFARLAEAAAYLRQIEPHSPVPYLIERAIEWGGLSAPDLYLELIHYPEKLSVFGILGFTTTAQAK